MIPNCRSAIHPNQSTLCLCTSTIITIIFNQLDHPATLLQHCFSFRRCYWRVIQEFWIFLLVCWWELKWIGHWVLKLTCSHTNKVIFIFLMIRNAVEVNSKHSYTKSLAISSNDSLCWAARECLWQLVQIKASVHPNLLLHLQSVLWCWLVRGAKFSDTLWQACDYIITQGYNIVSLAEANFWTII